MESMDKWTRRTAQNGDIYILDEAENTVAIVPALNENRERYALLIANLPDLFRACETVDERLSYAYEPRIDSTLQIMRKAMRQARGKGKQEGAE